MKIRTKSWFGWLASVLLEEQAGWKADLLINLVVR